MAYKVIDVSEEENLEVEEPKKETEEIEIIKPKKTRKKKEEK